VSRGSENSVRKITDNLLEYMQTIDENNIIYRRQRLISKKIVTTLRYKSCVLICELAGIEQKIWVHPSAFRNLNISKRRTILNTDFQISSNAKLSSQLVYATSRLVH
jgi:hypothetical protein